MSEKLGMFEEEQPEESAVEVAEPVEHETAAKPAEQPAMEPVETGETVAAPPAEEPEKQPQFIPITALLDEREKRQEATRQAEEYRRRLEANERQQREARAKAEQEQTPPDWIGDPESAAQAQAQQFEQRMMQQHLNQSRYFAERELGKEVVQEAVEFFNDPQFIGLTQRLVHEPSPYHAAVEFMNRQKAFSEIGNDPDAYREKLRAEIMAEINASSNPPVRTPPPASISTAPSTGKHEPAAVNAPPNLQGLFGS